MISRVSKPLLLAVLVAALVFPGLGHLTMSRQQELRVALTARHMVLSGNWFIPEFRDQPRLRKPPLMYWLVACSFQLVKNTMSVAAARVPSSLAGIVLVISTYLGGSVLFGRRRAYIAAFVMATSFMLIRYARLAETDVMLTLFMTLATMAGYVALRRSSFVVWLIIGILIGLGFLTKGPAALFLPLFAIGCYAAAQPSTRKIQHVGGMGLAILIASLVVVPWYLGIKIQSSAQIGLELRETFTEPDHPGPFYFYFYTLPKMMLPWGVFLPFALLSLFRNCAVKHAGAKFVAIWFISSFAALSLTANKQDHYALLLLPQSALFIGWYLAHISKHPSLRAWRSSWNNFRLTVALIVTSVVLVNTYIFLIGDRYRPQSMIPIFARQARPFTEKASIIYTLGARASQLEFYLGPEAHYATNFVQIWNAAQPGDVVAVSGDRKRPFPSHEILKPAALDMTKKDLRCALFVK